MFCRPQNLKTYPFRFIFIDSLSIDSYMAELIEFVFFIQYLVSW